MLQIFLGKIGKRSIYYYSTTTISAVILGIILVLTIRPGDFKNPHCYSLKNSTTNNSQIPEQEKCNNYEPEKLTVSNKVTTTDTLLDLVR